MGVRVFLDVDIGDRAAWEQARQEYDLAKKFFEASAPTFGWTCELEELEDEGRELLQESFDSNPVWSGQGSIRLKQPPSLRAGRIVIELYDKEVPKAAANFEALCTGDKGKGKSSGKPLHYKGIRFHRIVKGFVCQGGDIVKGDGSGGDSIYGGKFNDEKAGLKIKHDAAGVVSMANSGKNSNTSQFYITLAAAPACDGSHVVIGKVVEGLDVVQQIGEEASSASGDPVVEVRIADCGKL